MERISLPRLALILWGLVVLVENGVAAVVGIQKRWPGAFDVTPDPDHITLVSGSAIAAPLAPLVVLVSCLVLVALPWRWARVVGAVGAALVGVLFIIGTLGEPSMFQPESALEEGFHLVLLALALGLIALGLWTAVVSLRDPATQATGQPRTEA